MSGLEPGAKAPVQDDPPSSRASSEHSHLNFEEVIGLSVADHFEPGSQDSACWNKFNEVRWKVLRRIPHWPKLSRQLLEVFEHTRQLMWIFRSSTCICHWSNKATAAVFGPEAFDNTDWGPYCNGGLQGEKKAYLDVTLFCLAKAEAEGTAIIMMGPRKLLLPGLDHGSFSDHLSQICLQPIELVGIGKCTMLQIEGEPDFDIGDVGRRQISDLNSPVENAIGLLDDLLHSVLPGRAEVLAVKDQLLTAKDLRSPVVSDHWLVKSNDLSPQIQAMLFSTTGMSSSSSSTYGPLRLTAPPVGAASPAAAAASSPRRRQQRPAATGDAAATNAASSQPGESQQPVDSSEGLRHSADAGPCKSGLADRSAQERTYSEMRPAETEAASPSSSADTMYHDHEPHSQPQACQSNHAHLEEVDQQPSHPEFDFPASPGHVVFDDAVEDLLQEAQCNWNFDIRRLQNATNRQALSTLGLSLFRDMGLVDSLGLHPGKLFNFLAEMERGYNDNPYHNSLHSALSLQSLHMIMTQGGVMMAFEEASQPLILLTCYLAAIVHDFGHLGVNNNFLITSMDELALAHNDQSPHENHHLASSFTVLFSPRCNFMEHLPPDVVRHIRKLVISMVLKTDMSQHFTTISSFKSLLSSCRFMQDGRVAPDAVDYVLQMLLKAADLAHTTAARDDHTFWVSCLEEEMFRQGDREQMAGMAVSPLMSRQLPGMSTSQVGFFELVVIPLYEGLTYAFEELIILLNAAKHNRQLWAKGRRS